MDKNYNNAHVTSSVSGRKELNPPSIHSSLSVSTNIESHSKSHSPIFSNHEYISSKNIPNKGTNSDYFGDFLPIDEMQLLIENTLSGAGQTGSSSGVMAIAKEGLQHPRAVAFLLLWYMFSAGTLFLNKYILTYLNFNPYLMCEY